MMKGSTRRLLLTVGAACTIAIAGTALAANSGTFQDPKGDALLAPDLTDVAVSSDDAGTITVRISVAGGSASAALGEIGFGVDVDQNPDTGARGYGAEFAMTLEELTPSFFGVDASGEFKEAAKPASFQGSFSGNTATFVFKAADVAIGPQSGFNVFAIGAGFGFADTAPDIRTSNYQLVAGTPALVPGPDTRPPVDTAVKSSAVHGKRTGLPYWAEDGRGETADTLRIYRGANVVKTIQYRLSDTNPFFRYTAAWQVPKKARGKYRFCVSSVDRAGNKSNVSCAPLTIK